MSVLEPAPPGGDRPSDHPGFEARRSELEHGCSCIREWGRGLGDEKVCTMGAAIMSQMEVPIALLACLPAANPPLGLLKPGCRTNSSYNG